MNNKIKKCIKCGVEQDVFLIKTYKYGSSIINYYKDVRGRNWNGNRCHLCSLKEVRKRHGYSSRQESKEPNIVYAVEAENLAAKRFDKLGFEVEIGHGAGPDLFCKIGNITWTVEVKRAGFNSRRWRVSKVYPARKNDDLVAILLPNKYVYIDSMENHLKNSCISDGSRAVGSIVKQHGLSRASAG